MMCVRKQGEFKQRIMKEEKKNKIAACKAAKKCGGCQYQGIPYEKQLQDKQKAVRQLMQPFCKTAGITGMKDPYHYRNKVHAVFARKKDGTIISGVYEEGTHRVVPVETCQIEDEKADAIINDIRGLLKSFKIKIYNEDTGYGLLRHVLIRRGFSTGEIMVVLVLGSPVMPSKNNFVKALRKLHPEITTVVLNVNDKRTSMVLGDRETTIYGKGYIEDVLCGLRFRISSKSFYQINPVQTEKLYNKALEYADLSGNEIVWDLYCGIGSISLFLAKKAKKVLGVEIVPEAIEDARLNAKINKIDNSEFFVGAAEDVVTEYFSKHENEAECKPDVIVVDPPRKGCDEKLLSTIVKMNPKRVVYVSCDSATLARDVKWLSENGYKLKEATPCDMFGQTIHVETVCLLSRKEPN